MKNKSTISSVKRSASPRYALRKELGFWQLTFQGKKAIFKESQGGFYVAYLLLHQPPEPIHGMALALRTNALYGMSSQSACATHLVDPATGKPVTVESDALLQQRSLCLDEAEAAWALRKKQRQLEA